MGEDRALAFARRLATQDLRVQQGSSLLIQQMSAGEFNVVIDGLHYQIENQKQLGAPIVRIPDPLLIKDPSGLGSQSMPLIPTPPCSLPISSCREAQEILARQNRLPAAKTWNGAWRKKCRTECIFIRRQMGPRLH